MFDVILHQPEIPPNSGNVIRLCANTGSRLHLIEPLGFSLGQRALRRAGLDYAQLTQVRVHRNLADCLAALAAEACECASGGHAAGLRDRDRRRAPLQRGQIPAG